MSTQISFYILSANKKLIAFVCQLVQTVLNKSDETILIIASSTYLRTLDDRLWSCSDISFIPHQIIQNSEIFAKQRIKTRVILTDNIELITHFDGIVINLSEDILLNFTGSRLLEIIDSNPKNVEHGRQKYRGYQAYLQSQTNQNPQFGLSKIQVFHL